MLPIGAFPPTGLGMIAGHDTGVGMTVGHDTDGADHTRVTCGWGKNGRVLWSRKKKRLE